MSDTAPLEDCDEFDFLSEDAAAVGLAWPAGRLPARQEVTLASGRRLSAIRWGEGSPELVLLHGGTQNAHTWDGVALALDVPMLAVDLPGHGRSDWRGDCLYDPVTLAGDLAEALPSLVAGPSVVVGMSMGGLVGLVLVARHQPAARGLVLVDITPGHRLTRSGAQSFFAQQTFKTFDDLVEHASTLSGRSDEAARRTVWHNARRRPDGRWEWRHHFAHGVGGPGDYSSLWEHVASLEVPLMLVRGSRSGIVSDQDVDQLVARQPAARVEVVDGAGHSVQRSHPLVLAGLLRQFLPPL